MRITTAALLFSLQHWTMKSAALAGAKDDPPPLAVSGIRRLAQRARRSRLSVRQHLYRNSIANVTGGCHATIIRGRSVDADLETLGWSGQIPRQHVLITAARNCIGNLAAISEIEHGPTSPVEAYIEQSFWGGALTVKAGQQAADVEFFDSQTDDLFVNGTFGWPAIKATNLPAGGPAPPIAVPGVRVKAKLGEQVTAFAAIFNGNPARPGDDGDPQLRDNHGLAFRVSDPPWLVGQRASTTPALRSNGGCPATSRPAAGITWEISMISASGAGLSIAIPTARRRPQAAAQLRRLPCSSWRSTGRRRPGQEAPGQARRYDVRTGRLQPARRNLIDLHSTAASASTA